MAIEIFPVIHINGVSQAVDQAELAYEAGANGVYLIYHHSPDTTLLLQAYNAVAKEHTFRFVGLNLLQLASAEGAFSFIYSKFKSGDIQKLPDGIWADDAIPNKDELVDLRRGNRDLKRVLYLGGVAFKYRPTFTEDPDKAATQAENLVQFVDVVTTSGKGTGNPPSPDKIKAMKEAIGRKKLAVASGISIDNIRSYRGLFDQLLVSTSIETEPYSGIFVPQKLRSLIDAGQYI